MTDLLEVTALVVAALNRSRIRYSIGGSLASAFSGEPRASIDADILVDMKEDQIDDVLAGLGAGFYADREAIVRAIREKRSTNLIHLTSGIKIDLFIMHSRLDIQELERRRPVQVAPGEMWYVHSAEDILLQKLVWYREGGEVSDRQWRDVLAILLAQRDRLDQGQPRRKPRA